MGAYELSARIKSHLKFTASEIKALIVTIIVLAFVMSFRQWGGDTPDWQIGTANLLKMSIIVGFSILARVFVQKIHGLKYGYIGEVRMWPIGIFISLFLAFFSQGWVRFLGFASLMFHHHKNFRLGRFRYGVMHSELAWIAILGSCTNLLLAILGKWYLTFNPTDPFAFDFMLTNLLLAACTMVPIPTQDGATLFYANKFIFVFAATFFLITSIVIFYVPIGIALFTGLLVAIVVWFLWGMNVEDAW